MKQPPLTQDAGRDRSRVLDPGTAVLCGLAGIVVAAVVLGLAHC